MEDERGKKKTGKKMREDANAANRTTVRVKALKMPEGKPQKLEVGSYYWVSEDTALRFEKAKIAKIDDNDYKAKQLKKGK